MTSLPVSVPILSASSSGSTLIDARWYDYFPIIIYFAFVIGVGFMARRKAASSDEFLTSGRSLPAWVTGIAFVSANLGAVEIMGMSANGAQYGLPTFHYFWIGAIPAMIFLGLVMMPFYYGSKVRSVPEFMFRRYGTAAHLINALSFALAQLLIAGVNLYLLGSIVQRLLGWPLWVALVVAAIIVFSYITLGGLSAAIYNEVLQFFVIVAALLPLTLVGLHRVGGWGGLKESIIADATAHGTGAYASADAQLHSWPGVLLSGFSSSTLSVIGIVFGLGFVLSFGYWTTNFVEVQRAMAADSISSARSAPIVGTFAKMLVPFLVIIPGMVAAVLVSEIHDLKLGTLTGTDAGLGDIKYNDAVLLLMRDVLPNGLLGLAITGLLASFMAGMAANISAFNTVFTVDLYQRYVNKDADDARYLRMGHIATGVATIVAIFTALIASTYSNLMDYLQQLFSMFNAPLFATFIIGMFWKRATNHGGWAGLTAGTLAALAVNILNWNHIVSFPGQGAAFLAAGIAFAVDVVVTVAVSLVTAPRPDSQLKGFVYSLTPASERRDPAAGELAWFRRPVPLALLSGGLVILLNLVFH
ncbi:sodium:solute symporter family protein [Actinomyces massiliensis]|uniref:Transporter, SSS family n=1 Tax=Actinomyces massiliensis F0489 TaxID=1125718 RepID=J1HDZ6_9ACTO|nr:sodium:solute symporter family protein [Actinomyces massiliensis]EJF43618.1 transporter, SSS family [Actinomyces massiliensis F0489]WLD72419.1 sodium:solute symporter family protein [Actinomyces massiliensis]